MFNDGLREFLILIEGMRDSLKIDGGMQNEKTGCGRFTENCDSEEAGSESDSLRDLNGRSTLCV